LLDCFLACLLQRPPRYGTNSQPNERMTQTTGVDSFIIGSFIIAHRLAQDAGLK
jgi:hypothetical protein